MKYTFQIYKATLGDEAKGYVYARSEEEAAEAWKALAGLKAYHPTYDIEALKATAKADHFEAMEEAEFYVATPEEGGFVIMLSPDELSDRIIEAEHAHEPHVFYLVGLDDD